MQHPLSVEYKQCQVSLKSFYLTITHCMTSMFLRSMYGIDFDPVVLNKKDVLIVGNYIEGYMKI